MAFTENQNAVAELYIAALGRSPELAGLDYWVGRLESTGEDALTIEEIQTKFFDTATSTEVAERFPSTQTDAEYVEAIYVNVFGRASDAEGKAFWEAKIADGSTKADIMAEMLVVAKDSTNDAAALEADLAAAEASYDAEVAAGDVDALVVAAAQAQYDVNVSDADSGSAALLALELAAATAAETAIAAGAEQSDIDDALEVITTENFVTLRASTVAALAAANDAVTVQEDAIAEFLESTFTNEDVLDQVIEADGDTTNTVVGEKDASDVNVNDIVDAEAATAGDFIANVSAANEAAFKALTDAQQDAQIALGRTDLQTDIDDADDAINATAGTLAALESGVASDIATASAKGEALATAIDAADTAAAVEVEADTVAEAALSTGTIANAGGILTLTTTLTLALTSVTDGVISLTDDVVLNATTGKYEFTVDSVVQSITASYLNDYVTAAQATLDADAAVTAAEDALDAAIIDVEDGQGVANNGGYTTSTTNGVTTTTITYTDGDLQDYNEDLTDLADANTALTEFNAAVIAWEAADALLDQLTALYETLDDLDDDVDDAEDAITDPTPDGLDIALTNIAIASYNASADSDLYMATDVDTAITSFGDAGEDSIYVGTGYTLVIAGEDETIADSLGDATVIEAIIVDDGTDTMIYLEEIASAGNGTTDEDNNVITLSGVTDMTVAIDTDGFLTIA